MEAVDGKVAVKVTGPVAPVMPSLIIRGDCVQLGIQYWMFYDPTGVDA